MARLAILLALGQCALVHGLPAREKQHPENVINERAITLSSDIDITTSYSRVVTTLQSASVTESPSVTGVSFFYSHKRALIKRSAGHPNGPSRPRFPS